MPFHKVNDINMYYEIHGQGFPLVMIMGIRRDHSWFFRQTPELARHYKLLLFDNRGAGKTDKPDQPYSIKGMAADTAGLMKALGIECAHVLGVSMGGYIAQEVALNFPDKVRGLVLGCTSCGGTEAVRMSEELMRHFTEITDLSPEEILRRNLPISFSRRYREEHAGEVEDFIQMALQDQQPLYAFLRQYEAVLGFATAARLPSLDKPTLVMSGSDDELVPAANSPILAELIPDATLRMFPQGRHLFFIEMARRFNREVVEFLQQVEAG